MYNANNKQIVIINVVKKKTMIRALFVVLCIAFSLHHNNNQKYIYCTVISQCNRKQIHREIANNIGFTKLAVNDDAPDSGRPGHTS